MTQPVSPTPLGLHHRFDLFLARALERVILGVERARKKPEPPVPLSEHSYGPHARESLQVIRAKPDVPVRSPVVFVHGGGFIILRNRLWTRELIDFANRGYPVFNVEYPLAPEHPHPHMLLSLLASLRWIREHNPDIDGVHLMGDSAGGNLVMMLALFSKNPKLMNALGPSAPTEFPIPIKSVVSLYGVHDRTTTRENEFAGIDLMLEAYGGKAALDERVPANKAITPMDLEFDACPPAFLVAGSKDGLADSSRALGKRIEAAGNAVQTKIYEGEIHGFFALPFRPRYADLRRDIFDFLGQHDVAHTQDTAPALAETGE